MGKLSDLVTHNKAETQIILLGKTRNFYFDARCTINYTNEELYLKQRSATTMKVKDLLFLLSAPRTCENTVALCP